MNLVADESVDQAIVNRLRDDGHQVWYVADMKPGLNDEMVLQLANQQQAPLVTADKGFGELVFRQGRVNNGVVLIRLAGLSSARKATILASALKAHAEELQHAFVAVTSATVRIRRFTR